MNKWIKGIFVFVFALCFILFWRYYKTKHDISKYCSESLYVQNISLKDYINRNNEILLIYFHPDCDLCHGLLRQIPGINEDTKIVLLSYAEKNSIDSCLSDEHLILNEHINLIYDSLFIWSDKLKINVIPTTIYFNQQQLQIRKTGFFEINRLIN
jgi:hypothetical protein